MRRARRGENSCTRRGSRILVEDAGVGTALVTELQRAGLPALAIKPEQDKRTRVSIQSSKFESGQVFFPNRARWLPDLETELFAFPNSRHDDQVDAISQALAHGRPSYGWDENSLKNLYKFLDALSGPYWLR